MVVLCSISIALFCFTTVKQVQHGSNSDEVVGWSLGNLCCSNLCYLIMAPIVGVRVYQEMEINRINVGKLENFMVINDCGDALTQVDLDTITRELDEAHDEASLIKTWFWLTMALFIIEVCLAIGYPCVKMCTNFFPSHDDSEVYKRHDSSICEDKLVEVVVKDPEAEFMNNGGYSEQNLPQSNTPYYVEPAPQATSINYQY